MRREFCWGSKPVARWVLSCSVSTVSGPREVSTGLDLQYLRYGHQKNSRAKSQEVIKKEQLQEALIVLELSGQCGTWAYLEGCVYLLECCIKLRTSEKIKQIHINLINSPLQPSIFMWNTLINAYATCGRLDDAVYIFDRLHMRNIFTWTMIIAGFSQQGYYRNALELFKQMQLEGVKPDKVIFVHILSACIAISVLGQGKWIHAAIIKTGYQSEDFVGNALIDMYAKCGRTEDAYHLFEALPSRDIVSWNTIIVANARSGITKGIIVIMDEMRALNLKLDKVTYINILSICTATTYPEIGKWIHADILKTEYRMEINVSNTLMNMYCKHGFLKDAWKVFDRAITLDVVSWSTIIGVCFQNSQEALFLFCQMQHEGVQANPATFAALLSTCTTIPSSEVGKWIHARILNSESKLDMIVNSSVLGMYVKCGNMQEACIVFDRLPAGDAVSWSMMVGGFTEQGNGSSALACYKEMEKEGVKEDKITIVSILIACSTATALELGKQVHSRILKAPYASDVLVNNTLVDMYARCGEIKTACKVFDGILTRDAVSWNVIISGYAQQGKAMEALTLFWYMQLEDVLPDIVTLTSVFSACSHALLVDDGCHHFCSINQQYGATLIMEHFSCAVDLLGRAGFLDEARDFINTMFLDPSIEVWTSFLRACREHDIKHTELITELSLNYEAYEACASDNK